MKKLALALTLISATGCSSITHELQPHRLWRWNYQESPSRTDDALFSIDDPRIPAMTGERAGNNEIEQSESIADPARHE